jgi:hypothetical protein
MRLAVGERLASPTTGAIMAMAMPVTAIGTGSTGGK